MVARTSCGHNVYVHLDSDIYKCTNDEVQITIQSSLQTFIS